MEMNTYNIEFDTVINENRWMKFWNKTDYNEPVKYLGQSVGLVLKLLKKKSVTRLFMKVANIL